MSILEQLTNAVVGIKNARNTIRTKLVSFGLASGTDKLSALATALDGVQSHSGTTATVKDEATFTIPKGYHDGTTTVVGEPREGTTGELETLTVNPSDVAQVKTPSSGYDGFSSVTVTAIPDTYEKDDEVAALLETI